jgi:hypothetical protein
VITHIVMFKMDDQAAAAEAANRLTALVGPVPSLRTMTAGADILRSERSYDLGLVATFDDLAGLESYQAHPVHQEVAAFIRSHTTGSVAVDFES